MSLLRARLSRVGLVSAGPITADFVLTYEASLVTPAHIHCDATSTTCTLSNWPYGDLDYSWTFDDAAGSPVSGTTWAYGSGAGVNSRNAARGPITGHVFENAGAHTVTLTVRGMIGSTLYTSIKTQVITVADENVYFATTKTICYSATGSMTGAPTGAVSFTASTMEAIVANIQTLGAGYRHLLNRGESFSVSTNSTDATFFVGVAGPGIIGAYGTGNDPIVNITGTRATNTGALRFGGPRTGTAGTNQSGWRVRDLHFTSSEATAKPLMDCVHINDCTKNLLLLRLTCDGCRKLLDLSLTGCNNLNTSTGDATKLGHTASPGLGVYDCQVINVVEGTVGDTSTYPYCIYIEAEKFIIQGCNFDMDSSPSREVSHGIRVVYGWKWAIQNCYVARSGNVQDSFKLHAPSMPLSNAIVTTFSATSPMQVRQVGHNATIGDPFAFATSGSLPAFSAPASAAGLGKIYFVQSIVDADHFTIAETLGGAAINASTTGSGILASNYNGFNGGPNPNGWKTSIMGESSNAAVGNTGYQLPPSQGGTSRFGYVSDCSGRAASSTEWLAITAQQNNDQGQCFDYIVERCWVLPCAGALQQFPFQCESGTRVSFRNNLIDVTSSNYHHGIIVGRTPGHTAPGVTPDYIYIYNNTFMNADDANDFAAIVVDSAATNVFASNNLAYSPTDTASGAPHAVFACGAPSSPSTPPGSGLTLANNSSNAQIRSTDPLFVGASSTVAGWAVGSASYAKNAGTQVPVYADFFGNFRPTGAAMDIGAFEQ